MCDNLSESISYRKGKRGKKKQAAYGHLGRKWEKSNENSNMATVFSIIIKIASVF